MKQVKQSWQLRFFMVSVAIYPINTILTPLMMKIGLDSIGSRSIFIAYALIFCLMISLLIITPISLKRFAALLTAYLVYLLAYLITQPSLRHHFFQSEMVLTYILYLPYSILILTDINDFSPLLENRRWYYLYDGIIVGAFISNYFFDNPVGYMPFSYYLLPFWILYVFSMFQSFSIPRLLIGIILIVEGIFFGARGPLLFLVVAFLGAWLFNFQKSVTKGEWRLKRLWRFLGMIVLLVFMAWIILTFIGISDVTDSYIISKFEAGEITGGAGRSMIATQAIDYIRTMGIRVNGLFYDRLILLEGLYSHNFILETMISFGWILGPAILLGLAVFIGSTFLKANWIDKQYIVIFTCAFFLRYFISGSIYADWIIIVYLSLIANIKIRQIKSHRILY